jgi:hypothetical protein
VTLKAVMSLANRFSSFFGVGKNSILKQRKLVEAYNLFVEEGIRFSFSKAPVTLAFLDAVQPSIRHGGDPSAQRFRTFFTDKMED